MPADNEQIDLFGSTPSADSDVEPHRVDGELETLSDQVPATVRFGTSSWSFPGWAGLVYGGAYSDRQLARAGLEAYAQHPLLRTVSIDRTWYAPVDTATLSAYRNAVPPAFRFVVKAYAGCTIPLDSPASRVLGRAAVDAKEAGPSGWFLDSRFARRLALPPILDGLEDRLGAVVFQFPPLGRQRTANPQAFALQLGAFLSELPVGPTYAVEVRDSGLLTPEYYNALESNGVCHVFSVHPRLPDLRTQYRGLSAPDEQPATIVRWNLHGTYGYEEARAKYAPFNQLVEEDPTTRDTIAGLAAVSFQRGRPVFVTINNKAEGSAPLSVDALSRAFIKKLAR